MFIRNLVFNVINRLTRNSPERQLHVVARPSRLFEMLVETADPVQEILSDGENVTTNHWRSDGVLFVDGGRVDGGQVPGEDTWSLIIYSHLCIDHSDRRST